VLATIYIVIAVYRIYLNQMRPIRCRHWLTDSYLKDWLADFHSKFLELKSDAAGKMAPIVAAAPRTL
jgi:putative ATP-binding cassette transporter